jgi:hypothetical protein
MGMTREEWIQSFIEEDNYIRAWANRTRLDWQLCWSAYMDIKSLSTSELISNYSEIIGELKDRKVIRTNWFPPCLNNQPY